MFTTYGCNRLGYFSAPTERRIPATEKGMATPLIMIATRTSSPDAAPDSRRGRPIAQIGDQNHVIGVTRRRYRIDNPRGSVALYAHRRRARCRSAGADIGPPGFVTIVMDGLPRNDRTSIASDARADRGKKFLILPIPGRRPALSTMRTKQPGELNSVMVV